MGYFFPFLKTLTLVNPTNFIKKIYLNDIP
jgi:hypothetical protein